MAALDVRWWNLTLGVAAAGCNWAAYTQSGGGRYEDDDDSTNLTDDPPSATSGEPVDDETSGPSGDECDPACESGYRCYYGECFPETGPACPDGDCEDVDCYSSDDCAPGEYCNVDYACYAAEVLPTCARDAVPVRSIPLPDGLGGATALAFGDADPGMGEELLVVTSSDAVAIVGGATSATQRVTLPADDGDVWATAVDLAGGDGFVISRSSEGTRLVRLDAGELVVDAPSGSVLERVGSGDFDGDGLGDVMGVSANALQWRPGTGTGFGAAIEVLSAEPEPITIGDFDGDARDDIAFGSPYGLATYVIDIAERADGRRAFWFDLGARTAIAGNFDGVADSELASASTRDGVTMFFVLRGLPGGRSFEGAGPLQAASLEPDDRGDDRMRSGDFDGDGADDLVIVGDAVVRVVFGADVLEPTPFRCGLDVQIAEEPTAFAVGDLDGDGRDDIALASSTAIIVLAHGG